MGHKAIDRVLSKLFKGEEIKQLIYEFDRQESEEARFSYFCDKLECDIQSKLYDEENCVDLNDQENNLTANDELVKSLLDSGMSFGEMWITFGQKKYPYDSNFMEVSNYAFNNRISDVNDFDTNI